jgi:ribonuclease BN (tRNA processing enzyme)
MSHENDFPMISDKSPSAKQIAKMANKAGVKKLLLTHMRSHMDLDENQFQIKQELNDNFEGNSGIAEDLMKIEL